MIKKILIANRGEIACRIIRTAKKMGIKTVAVYSETDVSAMHVKLADEAVFIGQSPATLSYLNGKNILDAIKITGADAVHPGYGFLSENSSFAKMLEKNNINFIGPSSEAIKKMGDKIEAKKIAQSAGVNVVPGYLGIIRSEKQALKIADKIGYPIIIKAAAGGGGKGIRIVKCATEMKQAFSSTKNEAKNNFSDARTFIEKYIEGPRHIEIQVLGDKEGNYICLGERECSIQRHHQKVIEEAPSILIDEKTRKKMYKQSIALAKEVGYHSAGTVEYIMDKQKNFYFMEMNTRIQVEHPVTEMITGIDLIEQMIRIANNETLKIKQRDVILKGWSMESRIYAEDPTSGFLPSTGTITTYREPSVSPNIRIDTGVYEGGEVSPFYDAMIAKLCSYDETREECIKRMQEALGQYVISGISHNIGFLQAIYGAAKFIKGDISTNFLDEEYQAGFTGAVLSSEESAVILSSALYVFLTEQKRANSIQDQTKHYQRGIGTRWVVMMNEEKYPVTVRPIEDGYKIAFENRRLYITSKWILGNKLFRCFINGQEYSLQIEKAAIGYEIVFMGSTVKTTVLTPRAAELFKYMKCYDSGDLARDVTANTAGMVVDVKVKDGEKVTKGQPLVIIEAMKMENILLSNVDGTVSSIMVKKGDTVAAGDLLIVID